jgi:hypothetical protein
MQRYFFHIVRGEMTSEDIEGSELPSIEAARLEAELAARELVAHAILAGNGNVAQLIIIADEGGQVVDRIEVRTLLQKLRA